MRIPFSILILAVSLHGESLLTQQPGIPIPVNTWVNLAPHGPPIETLGFEKTVYAGAIGRHLMVGNYHSSQNEPNKAMVGYSFTENRFDVLDFGGDWRSTNFPDGGHSSGLFDYMPLRNTIVMYQGNSGGNEPETHYHTWWWDAVAQNGRDKEAWPKPNALNCLAAGMAYDKANDKFIFWGCGQGTWAYDPVANTWTLLTTLGTAPTVLGFGAMRYNTFDKKVYLFGGQTGGSGCPSYTFNSDVYTFDYPSLTWTKLTVTGGPPSGRQLAGFAHSIIDNIFLLVGGQTCSGASLVSLTDTWAFDPVALSWTQLSPAANYSYQVGDQVYEKVSFDEDNNVFVMLLKGDGTYGDGSWTTFPTTVWAYCYSGCPNAGRVTNTYAPPAGRINRVANSWATDADLAANGSTLYSSFVQSAAAFTGGVCLGFHPFVQSQTGSGAWTNLGADCLAIETDNGGNVDSSKTSLSIVNGTPWLAWTRMNPGSGVPWGLAAKSWNGSVWTGGAIGTRGGTPRYQGFSQIFGSGTTPTIAFIENNRTVSPELSVPYVDQWNGSAWVGLGGALNVNTSSRINSISGVGDGTNPWTCWVEEQVSSVTVLTLTPQVYCSHWNGSAWATSTSFNKLASDWAADVAVTYMGGLLYVAWTERTTGGNPFLYVASFNGTTKTILGGAPINRNQDTVLPANIQPFGGWPFHPRMANDGTNVYASWEEQQNLNQPSRVYLSKWNGSTWTAQGGTPNMDPAYGSAIGNSLAMANGTPVVEWTEVRLGTLREAYARQWNGTDWVALSAAITIASGNSLTGTYSVRGPIQ